MGEERENAGVLICGKRVRYIDPMTNVLKCLAGLYSGSCSRQRK